MLSGLLALAVASAFTGAAFYVNFAEHPARMALNDGALLAEWKPAYKRGFAMQATLALIACALGLTAWWQSGVLAFVIGALLILAPWPWTMLVIMPTNKTLLATKPANAGPKTRALIKKWNRLHAARTLLGALSVAAFVIALS